MSFIDDLKEEQDINNHKLEDAIVSEYIRSLKLSLKVKFQFQNITGKVCGYVKSNGDVYGFKFVEERLFTAPKCNTGLPSNSYDIRHLAQVNGCRIKKTYDYDYLKNALKTKLSDMGLRNCIVNIYINPCIDFKPVLVRKFLKTVIETEETVIKDVVFCCLYIECDV